MHHLAGGEVDFRALDTRRMEGHGGAWRGYVLEVRTSTSTGRVRCCGHQGKERPET